MSTALRHLLAVAALPVLVTIVVPVAIARRAGIVASAPTDALGATAVALGVLVLAIGLLLFGASLFRFATEGEGTLAPWDPPRRLVLRGPYRHVRNPMISGVAFVLFGEALVLRSPPHLAWALVFVLLNAIYIPRVEEPGLEARFGEDYRRYRRNVRRFLPRLRPWYGEAGAGEGERAGVREAGRS